MTRTGTGSFGVAFQGLSRPLLKTFTAVFPDPTDRPWPGSPKWRCFLKRGVPKKGFHCTIKTTKGTWLCLHFKDNMITVTTVQLMKSHDQLNLTLNSRQLNFITWMLRFYRTGNHTFYKKINGQKLQKRMPRIGNHWPLVPWLHCTDLCHSRRRRTF